MPTVTPANPPLAINGVAVTVSERRKGEGIAEAWPADGPAQAVVVFKCAWKDRYRVIAGLKGYTTQTRTGAIFRQPPLPYPDSPNLYCVGIDQVEGDALKVHDRVTGWPGYQNAYITARFSVLPWGFGVPYWDASGQPWTTSRMRSSGETFAPPQGAMKYTSGAFSGKPVEEASIGLVRARMEVGVTRRWLPYIPAASIAGAQNTINSVAIPFGDAILPVGTVLFYNSNSEPDYDGAGNLVYNVEYVMVANGDGHTWNEVVDPAGAWATITTTGGAPPYASSDFWNTLP